MNRLEFIEQLKKQLNKLPFDETKEAVDYYEQYFDEAGEENEQAVIAELGSPSAVASQIIAEFAVKDENLDSSPRRGLSGVWFGILAVFASPIALPIALTVVILALTLVIVMFTLIASIAVTGFALLLGGIFCAGVGVLVAFQSFSTFVFYLGTGTFMFGLGVLMIIPTVALSKKCFSWLTKQMSKFVLRRNAK